MLLQDLRSLSFSNVQGKKKSCYGEKTFYRKYIGEAPSISVNKETCSKMNRDGAVNFYMYDFLLEIQDQGRHQRQVSDEDQSVAIQLPSAGDGNGYYRNIRNKKICRSVLIYFDVFY